MNLSEAELLLIKEEEDTLRRLQIGFVAQIEGVTRDGIMGEIIDLNESMPHANSDDLPQVKAQLNRLDAVLKQIDTKRTDLLDVRNPYFGHMRLQDEKGLKDFFLGAQVYRTGDGSLQIIDWKTSPISRVYFLYNEGDAYEEEIEGRLFSGEIIFKRILRIADGELLEIQSGGILLKKREDGSWERLDSHRYLLKGGAGKATRPENTSLINPTLGIGGAGGLRTSKFLPEITALIDPDQFELIIQPKTGVVAVQGLAGSGKTTIALHRVAWLHFQDRHRFEPGKILVMVFNRALSNYISKVLPSLGVGGVVIENFESWIQENRIRLFSGHLPRVYSEQTPVSVIRFKKHPALFQLMKDYIQGREREFSRGLSTLITNQTYRSVIKDLESLPLITRAYTVYEWMEGKRIIQNCVPEFDSGTRSQLLRLIHRLIDPEKDRMAMLLDFWEDIFTDYELLKSGFKEVADEFSAGQMDEIIHWLKHQFAELGNKEPVSRRDLLDIMSEEGVKRQTGAALDYEDDPILVYLYQTLLKEIGKKNRKKLSYSHIMVDEVQDFSPIELAVLIRIADHPLSLTLAGDVNQKMIKESGFINWESTFETLGIKGQKVSTLRVGYRSTFEIMEFSYHVLGDLSENKEFVATRHGPPVELFQFTNQGELLQYLSKCLLDTMAAEPMASIAVICSSPEEARNYFEILDNVDISGLRLIDDQNFPFTPGIDLTDVRQVKGLEFDYVVLLDVDTTNYRNENYTKYLLHIAASRAAHQLWIMNYREPSLALPASYRKG